MKIVAILRGLLVMLGSCGSENYQEGPYVSPTKKYSILAKVNQSNPDLDNYADVRIILRNQHGQAIDSVNSGAGDFSKWAAGWMNYGDTVVLYSSDIGTKAWRVKGNKLQELPLQADPVKARDILQRAVYLKGLKYKQQ